MRRLFSVDGPFPPILLPIGGALLALALVKGGPAIAAETMAGPVLKVAIRALPLAKPAPAKTHTLYISKKDGYGLSDCLLTGKACGQVVADSWCSAHGYGLATAWGHTDDITASVQSAAQQSSKRPPKDHLAITCAE